MDITREEKLLLLMTLGGRVGELENKARELNLSLSAPLAVYLRVEVAKRVEGIESEVKSLKSMITKIISSPAVG